MKLNKLPKIVIPNLDHTINRINVLYLADTPNWSFHFKGIDYKKHLPQFDIDIGFANLNWIDQVEKKHYDIIHHLHEQYFAETKDLVNFIKHHNSKGTKVVLTINEVLSPYDIMIKKDRISAFNCVSVNNPYIYEIMIKSGFENIHLTYDGVDLSTFFIEKPFDKRDFIVFFSSSVMRLEHKGYSILQEVKNKLSNYKDIYFAEIYVDSFNNKRTLKDMNKIYNECKVFLCLSKSEGGPCTLLEASACGCVPVCTDVGYSNYFRNCNIIERNVDSCVDKILELKSDKKKLQLMHHGIIDEIKSWDSKYMSQQWGKFLIDSHEDNSINC